MRAWLILSTLSFGLTAQAEEVGICYNYDCVASATVEMDANVLHAVGDLFLRSGDEAMEREAIAQAIGLFETFAGQRTPTWADKGRNANDDGVDGRMDCIDESANATAYLRLLEGRGWLKFHLVLEPLKRAPFLVNDHWAARIVEKKTGQGYAVDSWFFDNGQPAFVVPLEEWRNGVEPNGK